MRLTIPSASLSALALLAAACAAGPTAAGGTTGDGGHDPVSIDNCGRELVVDEPPQRALANDINTTEAMLAVGLADRMVGIAGVGGRDEHVPEELAEDFDRLERISDQYIELEPLLGTGADFVFAGWNYGFSEASGLTPESLAERGVAAYALTESCAHVQPGKQASTIEETFVDLRNLGRIFDVEQRAEELIDHMRAELAEVATAVEGRDRPGVFVYDGGEDLPFTAPGLTTANDLVERAGGRNIFADLPETWTTVSWEQVTERDPDCVVIVDYGPLDWQDKRDILREHPATAGMSAVEEDCFLPLPYAAITPGVRNAEAVRAIAGLLHPEALPEAAARPNPTRPTGGPR